MLTPTPVKDDNKIAIRRLSGCDKTNKSGNVQLSILESFGVNRIKAYDSHRETSLSVDEKKQAALRYIMEAWEEAVHDGIEPELLANAAFFAALSDLVSSYGEEAVAKMTEGLSRRVNNGEFTLYRVTQ